MRTGFVRQGSTKQPRRPVSGGPGCEETTKIIGRDAEYSPETGYGKDLADACRAVAESTETPLPGLHAGSVRFFLNRERKPPGGFSTPATARISAITEDTSL